MQFEQKLRVAMLTPWLHRCGNAEGAKRLVAALERTGSVSVSPIDLESLIPPSDHPRKKERDAYFNAKVEEILASRPDVVHIQHEFAFFGPTLQEANDRVAWLIEEIGLPVVMNMHSWNWKIFPLDPKYMPDTQVANALPKSFRKKLKKYFYDKNYSYVNTLRDAMAGCKQIVLHNDHTKQIMTESWPEMKNKCKVIRLPLTKISPRLGNSSFTKPEGDFWILMPGFVTPYKGHIHGIKVLWHAPEHVKLIIAGGPHPKTPNPMDYIKKLLRLIDKSGLQERVVFTDFIESQEEQAYLFSQADAFFMPYEEVNQSGTGVLGDILEYLKPVVTSAALPMYGYRNSLDTVYSSRAHDFSNPLSVRDYERISKDLLRNLSPAELEHRCNVINRYSVDRIAQEWLDAYVRAASSRHH